MAENESQIPFVSEASPLSAEDIGRYLQNRQDIFVTPTLLFRDESTPKKGATGDESPVDSAETEEKPLAKPRYAIKIPPLPGDPESGFELTIDDPAIAAQIAQARDALSGIRRRPPPRPYIQRLYPDPIDLIGTELFEE